MRTASTCAKWSYRSKGEAERGARGLRKTGTRSRAKLIAYTCPACHEWHLGRDSNKTGGGSARDRASRARRTKKIIRSNQRRALAE